MLGGRIKPLRFRIMQTTSGPRSFMQGSNPSSAPTHCTMAPIRNRDGMLLTDKEDILKQWTLHFSTLLNRTSEVTNEALESIQQRPMIPELDAPPNTAEVDAAIKQLQTGKAPGPDGIPAEVFKAGGETLITHLTRMFQVFWVNGQLPRDLRDANIIHLYKNKGDRSSCDNHRGISLLSIAGKILARIMLNRITKHILDDVVSESQCGFRKQRGTVGYGLCYQAAPGKMCRAAPRPPPALHGSHQGIRHCESSCTLGDTQEAWMPTSICTDHPLLP